MLICLSSGGSGWVARISVMIWMCCALGTEEFLFLEAIDLTIQPTMVSRMVGIIIIFLVEINSILPYNKIFFFFLNCFLIGRRENSLKLKEQEWSHDKQSNLVWVRNI